LYGSESCITKARDARRKTTAAEMKCMRKTVRYTWTDNKKKKHRICKRSKYNPSFVQNTGIQKKPFATCKQNAP